MTPVFFSDRDLGTQLPRALREAGIQVERHADHFPDMADDETWLTAAGQRGWYCLTHDKRIRYKPNQRDTVMRAGVGLFVLVGSVPHAELAANFIATNHLVERFIETHNRPFIAKVKRPTARRDHSDRARPGKVEMWLSYTKWLESIEDSSRSSR